MLKSLYVLSLILVQLAFGEQAYAQKTCTGLFEKLGLSNTADGVADAAKSNLAAGDAKQMQYISPEKIINKQAMKEQGFKISDDFKIYDTQNKNAFVGQLAAQVVENTYQWGPLSDMKLQYENGGILKSEMTYILTQGAQAYGRGFYVSKNVTDSTGFGDGVTVFKANGPMLFIKYGRGKIGEASTDLYKRLNKAGVDAIEANNNEKNTWLSFISVKHLKTVGPGEIKDNFWDDFNNLQKIINIEKKLTDSGFWDLLPEQNFFRRMKKGEALDSQKMWDLIKAENFYMLQKDSTLSSYALVKNLKKALQDYVDTRNLQSVSFPEVVKILYFLKNTGRVEKLKSENEYTDILKYVDFSTLSKIIKGIKIKEAKSFEDVKQFAAASQQGRDNVNLAKIKNLDSFMAELGKIIPQAAEIRNYDVIMSSEAKTRSDKITVSNDAYSALTQNNLLTVNHKKTILQNNKSYQLVSVDYASFEKLLSNVDQLPVAAKTKSYLKNNKTRLLNNPEAPWATLAYKNLLAELAQSFFTKTGREAVVKLAYSKFQSPDAKPTALDCYLAFMSLHPLTDGNGRAGRLLYEYLTLSMEGRAKTLYLPAYDLDLLVQPAALEMQVGIAGKFLAAAATVKTDAEFKKLVLKLMKAYSEVFPNETDSIGLNSFELGSAELNNFELNNFLF